MDNYWITQRIKDQLETLFLEAILSVLDKITEQVVDMKKSTEEKF